MIYFRKNFTPLVQFHNYLKWDTLLNCKFGITCEESSLHQKVSHHHVCCASLLCIAQHYSMAECASPVYKCSIHLSHLDPVLNERCRLITNCLISTLPISTCLLLSPTWPSGCTHPSPTEIRCCQQAKTFKAGSRSSPHVILTQAARPTTGVVNEERPLNWNATNDKNIDNTA